MRINVIQGGMTFEHNCRNYWATMRIVQHAGSCGPKRIASIPSTPHPNSLALQGQRYRMQVVLCQEDAFHRMVWEDHDIQRGMDSGNYSNVIFKTKKLIIKKCP
ncbi:hypothetical protein CEXT_401151 [Caerostris extrusa]|uniref:Uncharacterized protein n=1 Tax=Caerostris extrusa TaxID=172846 RepID=A0AAV4PWM3_CAEEX|nr:hypothetical protein CEXT_401151 [Caerostris extrusa]